VRYEFSALPEVAADVRFGFMGPIHVRNSEVEALHEPWGKSGKRKAESGKRKHGGVFGNEGFKVPMRVQKQMEATHGLASRCGYGKSGFTAFSPW